MARDPSVTSRMMSAVKNKDSRAELVLRSELWIRGCRYRKNFPKVFGRPDVVFLKAKVAVFVDGDFWHGNAWRLRGLNSLEDMFPTRTEWWVDKITGNMERDQRVTQRLHDEGWLVLRYWESQVLANSKTVADQVFLAVSERRRLPAARRRSML